MQTNNPNQNQQKQSKNQKTLIYVLILLVLLSLGASGFLFYQNYQLKQQLSQIQKSFLPSPKPTQKPTASVVPIPTETTQPESGIPADWKTYTNEEYSISFSYPSAWRTSYNTSGFKYGDLVSVGTVKTFDVKGPQVTLWFIVAKPIKTAETLENWLNNEKLLEETEYEEIQKITRDIKLGDKLAVQIDICGEGCFKFLYTKYRDAIYAVVYPKAYLEEIETFDQILSTFMFIK